MLIHSHLRALAMTAAGLCACVSLASEVYIDTPGPNNLDTHPDGSFFITGVAAGYTAVSGVIATNTVSKTFDSVYSWSDSVVYLNDATFFGFDLQAHDTSTINYNGGVNPYLSLVTYDAAVINMTGGTVGFLGSGGGVINLTGGTVTESVGCTGGVIHVTGGSFGTPTYGLPYSFVSTVPSGVIFSGTGIVAQFMGVDTNGFDGNIWLLSGTLANGGSVEGLLMVDVGIFDPTVIVNYGGVTIAGGDTDQDPIANAGVDFSANEGETVMLDGTLSVDPDGDSLTYSWTQLSGGPTVALLGDDTATPSFTTPSVAFGGETLSFQLTVTANGKSSTDAVSVSVVNINHVPVAIVGDDQTVAEGAGVTLHGEDSFDIDGDTITYSWTQVGGSPAVVLAGANTANPTFVAPWVGSGGAALVFELRVDDGYPQDAPAAGYELSNVAATVTINITHLNGVPVANAGPNAVVNELSVGTLNGTASSDPDGDVLTYSWVQISGPAVTLSGASTATPTFLAPSVNSCGATVKFRLTVNDGYGGSDTDDVCIQIKNVGQPPIVTDARPSEGVLWPPNHQLECISIEGVTNSQSGGGSVSITITSVTQDEPTNGLGDGDTAVDAIIKPNGKVLLRAERSGNGNGRVYRVYFTATNAAGSSTGMVKVGVPHSKKSTAVDSGGVYISTQ